MFGADARKGEFLTNNKEVFLSSRLNFFTVHNNVFYLKADKKFFILNWSVYNHGIEHFLQLIAQKSVTTYEPKHACLFIGQLKV